MIGKIIWVIAAVVAVGWGIGMRQWAKQGKGVMKPTAVQAMLMAVALVLVPALSITPLHLLWLFPSTWLVGMLSLTAPFKLLWIPASLYYRIWTIGAATKR